MTTATKKNGILKQESLAETPKTVGQFKEELSVYLKQAFGLTLSIGSTLLEADRTLLSRDFRDLQQWLQKESCWDMDAQQAAMMLAQGRLDPEFHKVSRKVLGKVTKLDDHDRELLLSSKPLPIKMDNGKRDARPFFEMTEAEQLRLIKLQGDMARLLPFNEQHVKGARKEASSRPFLEARQFDETNIGLADVKVMAHIDESRFVETLPLEYARHIRDLLNARLGVE